MTQSLRLTQEQRLKLETQSINLRLELLKAIREEEYRPSATCPKCSRKLTPVEIIRGFNQDPNDYTTCCTQCGHRFEPRLICHFDSGRAELPFFCSCQTLGQMSGKEHLTPQEFAKKHPAIYRSAIVHHGGVRKAFSKIGIDYPYKEVDEWKAKIEPFLGRLPDTVIAESVDVSPSTVRRYRSKLGISCFSKQKMLEELS